MVVKPGETNQEVLSARQQTLDAAIELIDAHILKEAYEKSDTHVIYIGESGHFYPFSDWAYDELVTQYGNNGWRYVTVYTEKIQGSPPGWSLYLYLSTKSRKYVPFARDHNGNVETEWVRHEQVPSYRGVEHEAGDPIDWEKSPIGGTDVAAMLFWALIVTIIAFVVFW